MVGQTSEHIQEIRRAVADICNKYGEDYWHELDINSDYPTDFVNEMIKQGYLNVLIPKQYGGLGLGITEACAILEEMGMYGAIAGECHAQLYTMGSVLRHGSEQQKNKYLPKITKGELRLQSFGVTEPESGTDTTSLKTFAKKHDGYYEITGNKIWISRVEYSDLMLLLARTTPKEQCQKKTEGFSVFIIDLRTAIGNGLQVEQLESMVNRHSCRLTFNKLQIPEQNLLGAEGNGFKVILDGMNAERILIGAGCIGDAKYFINKATNYARSREVFGRSIGANQGVQFPLAEIYAKTEAASLMVQKAASLFDNNEKCGAEANMAKLLAAEASWKAGDICMQTHGGYGFAKEYHIERKFRDTRIYQVAPISTNLILSYIAERILDLPRSY